MTIQPLHHLETIKTGNPGGYYPDPDPRKQPRFGFNHRKTTHIRIPILHQFSSYISMKQSIQHIK